MRKIKLKYESKDFGTKKSAFSGKNNELTFNWNQLIWAAITVGRRSTDWNHLTKGSPKKIEKDDFIREIKFRKSMMEFAIKTNLVTEKKVKKYKLFTSEGFREMDGSEKTAIMYFLGTAFVKLFSSKLLYCPWLMHLDKYYNRGFRVKFKAFGKKGLSSTTRSDLIGLRIGPDILDDKGKKFIVNRWVAFEAKGRSKREKRALDDAKTQVENLDSVRGKKPLKIAFQTYISSKGEFQVVWQDPDTEISKGSYSLNVNTNIFLNLYYEAILSLFPTDNPEPITLGGKEYLTCKIDNSLTVGLNANIYNLIKLNGEFEFGKEKDNESFYEFEEKGYLWTEGLDGILIGVKDAHLDIEKEAYWVKA